MVYTKDTLIVNLYGVMDEVGMMALKEKLYRIISDYGIDNIILNISKITKLDDAIFTSLLDDYYSNFKGRLIVKEA